MKLNKNNCDSWHILVITKVRWLHVTMLWVPYQLIRYDKIDHLSSVGMMVEMYPHFGICLCMQLYINFLSSVGKNNRYSRRALVTLHEMIFRWSRIDILMKPYANNGTSVYEVMFLTYELRDDPCKNDTFDLLIKEPTFNYNIIFFS